MSIHDYQERRKIESIYLGRISYEVKIPEEEYHRILALIRATAVCEKCRLTYSKESPNVAGLLCLTCFLESHDFTFIGPLDANEDAVYKYSSILYDENSTYLFLDQKGHAYFTAAGPGHDKEARESKTFTLKYWHFPRPEEAEKNGQTVKLSEYGWSIYGNPQVDDVLIIQHGSTYYKDESLFVAKRDGQAIQINRRKPMHRALLAEARAELESTRTPAGMYLIDGEYQSSIHESDVYRLVAKRVGQAMTAARTEPQEPEPSEH